MHGRVFSPESRAQFLVDQGKLQVDEANELEGGKLFPATQSGLTDPDAPDDVANRTPPADGLIASGGHTDVARAQLNEVRSDWQKHAVASGQNLPVTWRYSAVHKTRRWTYWITKEGWDSTQPLARAQFDAEPLFSDVNEYRPYWGPESEERLKPKGDTRHDITLPVRKGYHVLLAVWDVADTAAAFYQVIDLDFQ
ncbi:lytic polysaccharide monooxygenase auxiliary activity family 9 protein [Burkholderia contaminans]|uniref:lytic polysaccharide monooxygenase auxiliary activity family 9 protein n=1 Tax=Burkholderia contaminans TaxID=488447 RepID=UPI003D671D52